MTDYDAPRHPVQSDEDGTLTDLKTRRTEARSGTTDIGEPDVVNSTYFVGLDLLSADGEEASFSIQPIQGDEFLCSRCFLVQHRSRLSRPRARQQVCRDCE